MDSMTYSYNAHNNQLNTAADGVPETYYNNLDIYNEVGNNSAGAFGLGGTRGLKISACKEYFHFAFVL
jgi:hypothetical protein